MPFSIHTPTIAMPQARFKSLRRLRKRWVMKISTAVTFKATALQIQGTSAL